MERSPGEPRYRITRCGVTPCSRDWVWENSGREATEANVWLVAQGHGWAQRRGKTLSLQPGDCFVWRHAIPHRAWHDPRRPLLVPWVCFECLDAGQPIMPPESALPQFYRRVDSVGFLSELISRCVEARGDGRDADALGWLEAVLLEVQRQDARPLDTSLQRDQVRLIDALCRDVERNVGRFRRVDDLAGQAGYSADHFIRIFRRVRQITPGEFLIRTRIRRACDLLRFSSRSITDIAEDVGYGDVYAFSKQFRQRMGQSPTFYRRGDGKERE